MKAYVVVEGVWEANLIRLLLAAENHSMATVVEVGPRSTLVSIARSLLITRRAPTAVVMDAHSLDKESIREMKQSTMELLGAVSGPIPIKVIAVEPTIASLLISVPGLRDRLPSEEIAAEFARKIQSDPNRALSSLIDLQKELRDIDIADVLTSADLAELRQTPPMVELNAFLSEAAGLLQASRAT